MRKVHLDSGNNVPACRNNISRRGPLPLVTLVPAKVTCDKCKLHISALLAPVKEIDLMAALVKSLGNNGKDALAVVELLTRE